MYFRSIELKGIKKKKLLHLIKKKLEYFSLICMCWYKQTKI